jgi:methionine-rich copper-binding protein CopC
MSVKTVKATINGQEVTLTLNSSTGYWEATTTAPSTTSWAQTDHKYGVSITATDNAGNSTTVDRTDATLGTSLQLRVLEKTAPTISVTYPTASAYVTNSKPTIKWTVTDAGSGIDTTTISVKVDSGTAVTSGITTTATTNGYTCQYTPSSALSEGSHTIKFNVSDNDGNAATEASVTFKVDTVPPSLSWTSPADGAYVNSTTISIVGTTNDDTSSPVTLTAKVGSGSAVTIPVSNGAFNSTVTGSEGANTIVLTATDAAGKTTTITRTINVDTKAPTITEVTLTPNPVDAGASYVIKVKVTD